MENLKNFGVSELRKNELQTIEGGSVFLIGLGVGLILGLIARLAKKAGDN